MRRAIIIDMSMPQSLCAANNADFPPVSILFQDRRISELFAELLEGWGQSTRIISGVDQISGGTKVVTEHQYFTLLPDCCRAGCLLVGDAEANGREGAITLARPLTEEKIEAAIRSFLVGARAAPLERPDGLAK